MTEAETKNTKAFYNTEIPIDWEVKELGKIALVNMGQSPDSENYNEIEDGLPLIQGNADIRNRKSFKRYFTTQLTKVCDEGDLILSVRAPVGSIGEASFKSCIGRGVCALKPNKVDKEYLYQLLLNSEDKWKKIEQGSTFTAVSSDDVRKFKLLVPKNEAEQKAIAKVLSTADASIQTTEKLIAQKELRKKWLMQQLLTGKKRLKGFESAKWHLKSLEEVADFKNGKAHENTIYENGKYLVVNSKFISTEGKAFKCSDENLCPLFIDDIVMVMSDIPNGKALAKCFYIEENNKYTLNQRICSISAFENTDSKFLFFILNRNVHYLSFDNGVGQTNLKKEEVLECPILIPEKEEQTAIAQVLQAADKEISLLKAKNEKLREQKKGLMQVLLTGKVRLKIN